MATQAWIARNKRKLAAVKKYAALRAELKAKGDYIGIPISAARMSKWSSSTRPIHSSSTN